MPPCRAAPLKTTGNSNEINPEPVKLKCKATQNKQSQKVTTDAIPVPPPISISPPVDTNISDSDPFLEKPSASPESYVTPQFSLKAVDQNDSDSDGCADTSLLERLNTVATSSTLSPHAGPHSKARSGQVLTRREHPGKSRSADDVKTFFQEDFTLQIIYNYWYS
ncbi:hypothetical protein BDQ17DRAFT_1322577 [Cyathus striatus]|nr:hypothetical protein BDQ17DRAFT_1322577 [Cyathus striatus]